MKISIMSSLANMLGIFNSLKKKKKLKTIKLNVLLYFGIFNSLKIDVYDFIFGKQNILLKRFTYIFL